MNASAKPDKQENVEKWLEINYCQLDLKETNKKQFTCEQMKNENPTIQYFMTLFAFYE